MKTYVFSADVAGRAHGTITAKNEKDALAKLRACEWDDYEVYDVRLVKVVLDDVVSEEGFN